MINFLLSRAQNRRLYSYPGESTWKVVDLDTNYHITVKSQDSSSCILPTLAPTVEDDPVTIDEYKRLYFPRKATIVNSLRVVV